MTVPGPKTSAMSARLARYVPDEAERRRLLRTELEIALQELVGAGLVNADSFAGLRALLLPAAKRSRQERRARTPLFGMAFMVHMHKRLSGPRPELIEPARKTGVPV